VGEVGDHLAPGRTRRGLVQGARHSDLLDTFYRHLRRRCAGLHGADGGVENRFSTPPRAPIPPKHVAVYEPRSRHRFETARGDHSLATNTFWRPAHETMFALAASTKAPPTWTSSPGRRADCPVGSISAISLSRMATLQPGGRATSTSLLTTLGSSSTHRYPRFRSAAHAVTRSGKAAEPTGLEEPGAVLLREVPNNSWRPRLVNHQSSQTRDRTSADTGLH
jgi:hypothetical protein